VEWVLLFAVVHEAEVVRQGAVSLALGVCRQLVQVILVASPGVSVVMRYADGGGGLTIWRQKWCMGWYEGRGVSIVFIRQSGDVDV
jgi:hypothetical protein